MTALKMQGLSSIFGAFALFLYVKYMHNSVLY